MKKRFIFIIVQALICLLLSFVIFTVTAPSNNKFFTYQFVYADLDDTNEPTETPNESTPTMSSNEPTPTVYESTPTRGEPTPTPTSDEPTPTITPDEPTPTVDESTPTPDESTPIPDEPTETPYEATPREQEPVMTPVQIETPAPDTETPVAGTPSVTQPEQQTPTNSPSPDDIPINYSKAGATILVKIVSIGCYVASGLVFAYMIFYIINIFRKKK
ncbi:MAG: hypothetical protein LBI03_08210 [Clostridiales bacterium]|nr:hypothetical protein [Clostridiales bacterium]